MASPDGSHAPAVAEIMSRPVVTARRGATIADAANLMKDRRVGSVVVVDDDGGDHGGDDRGGPAGHAVGILTERDLVRSAAAGAPPTDLVGSWMTAEPFTVGPGETVGEAFARLAEHGFRHIPVVDGSELVGIVSMRDLMKLARIQPAASLAHEVPKGLEGVEVAETAIGDVRGLEGFYHYRQYSAIDLAGKRSLEDVWHLLVEGHLPSATEARAFADEVAALRPIPGDLAAVLPELARLAPGAAPLDLLRTTVSLLTAAEGFRPSLDVDAPELRRQALRICAVVPTLLTSTYRLQHGLEPVEPDPSLPYAANYLAMLTGERPGPEQARAVEQYLISTIDHGFNSSTFTARVVTSTGADLGSAVVAAIGALSGPLHGGAPSRALDMLDEIGVPERAEPWLRDAVERGDRIMGFGHRVYKTDDPRSVMLRGVAERLGGEKVDLARHIEQTAIDVLAEMKPGRRLYTNVEFYAGVVMDACGVPREMFTPTFASSRVIGWCTHAMEQAADNRLIRPSARYVGPPPPQPVPDPS